MTIGKQRNFEPSVPQPQTLALDKICVQLHATMDEPESFLVMQIKAEKTSFSYVDCIIPSCAPILHRCHVIVIRKKAKDVLVSKTQPITAGHMKKPAIVS